MNGDPIAARTEAWNEFRSDLKAGRQAVKEVLEVSDRPRPAQEVVIEATEKSGRCRAVIVRAIWDLVDDREIHRVDDSLALSNA
jgi:hypothetical protein